MEEGAWPSVCCESPQRSLGAGFCMLCAAAVSRTALALFMYQLYQLPGLGSGASLSAAAGICKTSCQNPKARPDLTRFCGLLLTSSGFARVSLHGFLWNCS